jgi:hypothetical protein
MQRSTILLFAVVLSLPLALMVLARSNGPASIEPNPEMPGTTPVTYDNPSVLPAAASESHVEGECSSNTCDVGCPLESCSAGPCDSGLSAKCVCRSDGRGLCGCIPCS